jgi:peptidoglycan/LPS O-acetylase OafA/YrhL
MTSPRRAHVYEADVVRVLTFACVIAVHTISHTNSNTNVPANGIEMLLHFTREAFFCLTGFVLLHQSLGRPMPVRTFWRRRFVAVGAPYLAWTVIYTGIQTSVGFVSWAATAHHLADNVLYGTAWYHMYFLLVSMQIYLLFPVIAWLVRRTAGHHGALLTISALVQLAILTGQMYFPPHHGWLAQLASHQDALIVSYQFYVLLGAVAAVHFDELRERAARHRRGLLVTIGVAAVVAEVWYLVAVHRGYVPVDAAAVLQPVMLGWSVAAIAGLALLGLAYSDRRIAGSRLDRALSYGSDRSFGVFLVHPAVLWLLLEAQGRWLPGLNAFVLTVAAYLCVVAGSIAVIEVFRRSRLSLLLTGRHRLAKAKAVPELTATREESTHVRDNADTAGARVQATSDWDHDGDRHRSADAVLRRHRHELQRAGRRDEARLGNGPGDR